MTFHQLKKLGGCINASCFEFLPKENWIISVLGSTINIHNYSTGALIKSYEYHNDPLICIVVIQSKTNLELFSLDELGLIKCVNLKTDFMIFSFHLKENVKAGFINKKMKKIYYTTKNVLKIFNFFNNEISSINPKVENSELTEFHGLKSSKDENFAVEFSGKNIILYDLTENKILNIIKHDNFISSIDLNHDNTILAVGDVIGKIYFYYDPLTAKEGKIKSAKFHWHCKKVLSLRFNTISNVLLSGGSENVLVLWYFMETKKNFCPRLSSPILNIFSNEEETIYFLLLEDNSIQIIKSTNFLEFGSFKFITNPLKSQNEPQSSLPFFKTGIIQHPTQNVNVMNGFPGDIQFIDCLQNKKIASFKVVRRHLTTSVGDINTDPLEVTKICFDATGKIMMTAVNKAKKDGVNQNSSSSLYFWEELNLFDYGLNTRVDNIHGDEIFGIVNLQRNNEKTEEIFATYGSDNKFKLWKRVEKEKQSRFHGKTYENNHQNDYNDPVSFYWNCFYENSYKNLKIDDMCYLNDKISKRDLLCFTIENGVVFWDINSFEFVNVIETNLVCNSKSKMMIKACDILSLLLIYNEKNLMIYSVIKKEPVLKISFDKIIQCLVYEEVCYALIENDSDGKIIQTILKINLKELVILKSFFFISNLKDIFIKKENNKFYLIALEDSFTFLLIESSSNDLYFEKGPMEIEAASSNNSNINLLWTANEELEDSKGDFTMIYQQLARKITHKNKTKIDLFNSNSHFIPKISLLYNNYLETILLKDEENESFISKFDDFNGQENLSILNKKNENRNSMELEGEDDIINSDEKSFDAIDYVKQLNSILTMNKI